MAVFDNEVHYRMSVRLQIWTQVRKKLSLEDPCRQNPGMDLMMILGS
jgi:hypothetical protein